MSLVVADFLKMSCLYALNFYCVDEFSKTQNHPAEQQVHPLPQVPRDRLAVRPADLVSLVEEMPQQLPFVAPTLGE
jgi:hypothetical protein